MLFGLDWMAKGGSNHQMSQSGAKEPILASFGSCISLAKVGMI